MRRPRHDRLFFLSLAPFAALALSAFALLFVVLAAKSAPIFSREGLSFFISPAWSPCESNPEKSFYGVGAPLFGTLVTSALALALALPASVAMVVFVNEVAPPKARAAFSAIIDMAAGIPTVIYGLWGLEILAPFLRSYIMAPLHAYLGFIPLFSCQPVTGYTLFTAGVLLAVMITPYTFSLINEAYSSIPSAYREAVYSLGARRYEASRILLSMVKPAVIGAALLGLGRACSETVAVALVVGNCPAVSACLFSPGYTVSSLIATQFAEAGLYRYMLSALYAAGLTLLALGFALSAAGLVLMSRWRCRV